MDQSSHQHKGDYVLTLSESRSSSLCSDLSLSNRDNNASSSLTKRK